MLFWKDTCISSNDSSEPNQQMQRKREIYEKASTFVGWLGRESAASKVAIPKIIQLEEIHEDRFYQTPSDLPTLAREGAIIDSVTRADQVIFGNASGPLGLDPWVALDHFLARPYWRQLSTVPESAITDTQCSSVVRACCLGKPFKRWGLLFVACKGNQASSRLLDFFTSTRLWNA